MLENTAKVEATATAGLVNVTKPSMTNTLTLNIQSSGEANGKASFPQCFLEGIAKAKDPVGYATRQAEALSVRSKALADACELYRKTFPTFNDNQICLLAFGYTTTAAEADNIADVLHRASNKLPEGATPDALPVECIDEDVKGAATAYEEELREMWASLIAEEVAEGTAYRKRTKHALGEMSAGDVRAFRTLCSYSPWTKVGPSNILTPVPVLASVNEESWTSNGGAIVGEDLATFDSLGLIDTSRWTTFTIKSRTGITFDIGSMRLWVVGRKDGTEEQEVCLGSAMFLSPGVELAKICNADPAETLENMARISAKDCDVYFGAKG